MESAQAVASAAWRRRVDAHRLDVALLARAAQTRGLLLAVVQACAQQRACMACPVTVTGTLPRPDVVRDAGTLLKWCTFSAVSIATR